MDDDKLLELANTSLLILKGRHLFKIKKDYFLSRGCRDYVVDSWLPSICKYVTSIDQLDIIIKGTSNLEVGFLDKENTIKNILNITNSPPSSI